MVQSIVRIALLIILTPNLALFLSLSLSISFTHHLSFKILFLRPIPSIGLLSNIDKCSSSSLSLSHLLTIFVTFHSRLSDAIHWCVQYLRSLWCLFNFHSFIVSCWVSVFREGEQGQFSEYHFNENSFKINFEEVFKENFWT